MANVYPKQKGEFPYPDNRFKNVAVTTLSFLFVLASKKAKKHRDCGGERYTGISPMANIFARGSREPAPVAMLAKCEPTFAPVIFGGVELWRVLRE